MLKRECWSLRGVSNVTLLKDPASMNYAELGAYIDDLAGEVEINRLHMESLNALDCFNPDNFDVHKLISVNSVIQPMRDHSKSLLNENRSRKKKFIKQKSSAGRHQQQRALSRQSFCANSG